MRSHTFVAEKQSSQYVEFVLYLSVGTIRDRAVHLPVGGYVPSYSKYAQTSGPCLPSRALSDQLKPAFSPRPTPFTLACL